MRVLYCPLLLLLSSPVYAQQLGYVPSAPATYRLNAKDRVPAYAYLADTSQAAPTLAKDEQVVIVGRRGTRWAVLQKNGIDYFVRARYVQGLPAPTPAELVVPANVPARPMPITASAAAPIDSVVLPVDGDTHLITYSKVVPVAGASTTELYARAKLWHVSTFTSGKDVLQADEKEAGVVVGRGWGDVYIKVLGMGYKTRLWYTVKLAVRDGRYRYDLSHFAYEDYPSRNTPSTGQSPVESFISVKNRKKGTQYSDVVYSQREQLDAKAKELAASIEAGMSKPAAGGKSDW